MSNEDIAKACESIEKGNGFKKDEDYEEAAKCFAKAARQFQSLDLLRYAVEKLPDGELKYAILSPGIDFPYRSHNDWCSWQYYDLLSIMAFYRQDFHTAARAYYKLTKHKAYPKEHQPRIEFNSQYCKPNVLYHQLCSKMAEVSAKLQLSMLNPCTPVIHFIYLQGYKFGLHHYIAVASAAAVQKYDRIHIYNDIEPSDSEWWDRVKQLPRVHIIPICPANMINGNWVHMKQHQADIIRLCALKFMGGVYMDLDMLSLKPFDVFYEDQLWPNKCTVAVPRECEDKLCNCIIMAIPGSPFIVEWLKAYENSYGEVTDWWGGLSVRKPYELSKTMPCYVLETSAYLPFDYWHTEFFTKSKSSVDFSKSFGIHLWDTEQQKRGVLPRTVEEFRKSNSVFYQLFGHYVKAFDSEVQGAFLSDQDETDLEKSVQDTLNIDDKDIEEALL